MDFTVDSRSFLEQDGRQTEEFLFRIATETIFLKPANSGFTGAVRFTLSFRDILGKEIDRKVESVSLRCSNEPVLQGGEPDQLVTIYHSLPDSIRGRPTFEIVRIGDFGNYLSLPLPRIEERLTHVIVKVEDLGARKRGLAYLFTRRRKDGVARLEYSGREFPEGKLSVSDPEFCWSVRKADERAKFEKSGLDVLPNPGRTYGILNSTLTVYYEMYNRRDGTQPAGGEEGYLSSVSIVAPGEKRIQARTDSLKSSLKSWVRAVAFDLSEVPAGSYILRIGVSAIGDTVTSYSQGQFDVIWDLSYWEKSEQSVLDETEFLFPEKEFEEFEKMGPGERQRTLAEFWKAQDPTPATARNEVKQEFERRVRFANDRFSTVFLKGMLSDRGKVYIQYGDPEEVRTELLPVQGRTATDVLKEIAGEKNPEAKAEIMKDPSDIRPHEVWIYDLKGRALFSRGGPVSSSIGMRFIFVDEDGYGNFMLKYSTEHKKN
ncbi:MAG: GWxTD domain-containing protein [Candidatus Eisenbacteria bacterium]|nr:GWxTD domain-containing protein [Candidatus Eisenbacteria bacterium]